MFFPSTYSYRFNSMKDLTSKIVLEGIEVSQSIPIKARKIILNCCERDPSKRWTSSELAIETNNNLEYDESVFKELASRYKSYIRTNKAKGSFKTNDKGKSWKGESINFS